MYFNLLRTDGPHKDTTNVCAYMMTVGNSFDHSDERQQVCARFVCSRYGYNSEDTGRVRHKLFCNRNAQTSRNKFMFNNCISYTNACGCASRSIDEHGECMKNLEG